MDTDIWRSGKYAINKFKKILCVEVDVEYLFLHVLSILLMTPIGSSDCLRLIRLIRGASAAAFVLQQQPYAFDSPDVTSC